MADKSHPHVSDVEGRPVYLLLKRSCGTKSVDVEAISKAKEQLKSPCEVRLMTPHDRQAIDDAQTLLWRYRAAAGRYDIPDAFGGYLLNIADL